jgi:hypothetical protein
MINVMLTVRCHDYVADPPSNSIYEALELSGLVRVWLCDRPLIEHMLDARHASADLQSRDTNMTTS